MDRQGAQAADPNKDSSETAPLLVEEEESHVQPVITTDTEASTGIAPLYSSHFCLRPRWFVIIIQMIVLML